MLEIVNKCLDLLPGDLTPGDPDDSFVGDPICDAPYVFSEYGFEWDPEDVEDLWKSDRDLCLLTALNHCFESTGFPSEIIHTYKNSVVFVSTVCEPRLSRAFIAVNFWTTSLALVIAIIRFINGKLAVPAETKAPEIVLGVSNPAALEIKSN